jgi:hypothetical protein
MAQITVALHTTQKSPSPCDVDPSPYKGIGNINLLSYIKDINLRL